MKSMLPSASDDEVSLLVESVAGPGHTDLNVEDFLDRMFPDSTSPMSPRLSTQFTPRLPHVSNEFKEVPTPSHAACAALEHASTSAGSSSVNDLPLTPPRAAQADFHLEQSQNFALLVAEAARELLPNRVILVRHGESEGNVDPSVYSTKPDHAVELTELGSQQALDAGRRIKEIVGEDRIQLVISPFQRTMQTARNILTSIRPQVQQDVNDPRIREQEFGNLQGDDFQKFRNEQKIVGRYFYRFPTGESGADVHARVKDWWDSSLLQLNIRPGYKKVDAVVVVTHGLTMRFIMMQLFNWSPNTFQTVWNAKNCDIYVLKRDLSLPGQSPFFLDASEGDAPKSTISLMVEFRTGEKTMYRLDDYLEVPMPRSRQPAVIKQMLAVQHGLKPDDILNIDFYGGMYGKYQ